MSGRSAESNEVAVTSSSEEDESSQVPLVEDGPVAHSRPAGGATGPAGSSRGAGSSTGPATGEIRANFTFKSPSKDHEVSSMGATLSSALAQHALPDFNKRPPTDTPLVSTSTSPIMSNINSKDTSMENSPELKPSAAATPLPPVFKLPKRRPTTIDLPGITRVKSRPNESQTEPAPNNDPSSKLVIIMVGLPARGKSYITNKLTRYLNWVQHECKVFNVGNTRRKENHSIGPANRPVSDLSTPAHTEHDANFFNPDDVSNTQIREKWAIDTLDELLDYLLYTNGAVGIFDATNSTKKRRLHIKQRIEERCKDLKILYLESICTDPVMINKNIALKLKGPDYRHMDPDLALQDFTERLHNYEKAYETVEDDENLQYIKMIDVGKKVVAYNIHGFLASQTIYYLLNFNLEEKQIWITRHGESEDNVLGKVGGDSDLTSRGLKFSKALAKFIENEKYKFINSKLSQYEQAHPAQDHDMADIDTNFLVWSSMLKRSVQTASFFSEDEFDIREIRLLNELSAGICEGLTYEQIQEKFPNEFNLRLKDKLRYRYPGIGGESYLDVINRIRPMISEIERTTENLLIITHRVVARVLLGYFLNLNRDVITNLDVPLHCVYLLETKAYGVEWTLFEYNEALDTFEKVPKSEINQKKYTEVGFKERKYSIVPTIPPNSKPHASRVTSNPRAVAPDYRGKPNIEFEKLQEKLAKLKNQRS